MLCLEKRILTHVLFSSCGFFISDNLAKGHGITGVGYGWDYEVLAGVYLVVKRTLQKRGLQKTYIRVTQQKGPFWQSMVIRMFCFGCYGCKCYLYENYFSSHSSLDWLSSGVFIQSLPMKIMQESRKNMTCKNEYFRC